VALPLVPVVALIRAAARRSGVRRGTGRPRSTSPRRSRRRRGV